MSSRSMKDRCWRHWKKPSAYGCWMRCFAPAEFDIDVDVSAS